MSNRTDQQRRERILAKRADRRAEHTDKYQRVNPADRYLAEKLAQLSEHFNGEEADR